MDDKALATFRRKLIEDVTFRQEFAADPDGALRKIGIDVPKDANIAPIDPKELDDRVARLKTALGDKIGELYSVEDFAKVARDPQKMQRIEEIMNIARKSKVSDAELEAVAGGTATTVYTISAYGTLDW
jgi:hypothetical protein